MCKRWAFLAAVGAAAVLLAGCLNTNIIEDPQTVKKEGDAAAQTIVFWHTYSDEEARVFEEFVLPEFEQEHPKIQVESVRQESNSEYQAALVARASANKPPDVIRMDNMWVSDFASKGLLYPLSSFPDASLVADALLANALISGEYESKLYGLPLNITTKAAIYNRELLEQANISVPPSSLEDVIEAAREHHLIIGMSQLNMWSSLPYFFALGGMLSNEAFTKATGYFNSEASIRAVSELVGLYQEGVINPELLTGHSDLWNDLYSGNDLIMIDEGPWYYSILLNSQDVHIDLLEATVPAPFPSDGAYGPAVGGEHLVLTKGSRVKEEAWTFIQWMMRKETQLAMFEAGLIPTNREAFYTAEAILEKHSYLEAYLQAIEKAYYRPPHPRWNQIDHIYTDALEAIFIRGDDVQQTLDQAAEAMDAVLSGESNSSK